MQTSKKRILGAAGLATVAGMTIVAHGMPAPAAYATSSNQQVQLTVYSAYLDLNITGSLQDGGATSKDEVSIPITVTDVEEITYTLTASQSGATSQTAAEGTIILDSGSNYTGTYNLALALSTYRDTLVSTYGYDASKTISFTLAVTGTSSSGGVAEDGITFTYGSATIDPNTNIDPDASEDETNTSEVDEDSGNPIINVETDDEVETIHVIVRDPDTGEIVWEGDFPAGTDITKIELPFAENGIPSGNYVIEIYAYDEDGNLIGTSSLTIRYVQPDAPGLPNTGAISIAGLNIARADFLISSALAFCLVALGGIYLIHKKSARK